MTPAALHRNVLTPALDLLLSIGGPARDRRADVLLVAICGQEANWMHRAQLGGPARGLWQFEHIGVAGVLEHRSSRALASAYCAALDRPKASAWEVYRGLATDDILAAGIARLLLHTDPNPLPSGEAEGWSCYLRTWRPGKPHRHRWTDCYRAAVAAVAPTSPPLLGHGG